VTLAARLASVQRRVADATLASGRTLDSVRLIAVSKGHPASALRDAYALGVRDFGESYAQELEEKSVALTDLPDLQFHFIGHLQSNKARQVVPRAALVHSVDSARLARELGKRAHDLGRVLPILLEVNVAAEPQKSGILPGFLAALLLEIAREPALTVRGLMTLPPQDLALARDAFHGLRQLRDACGGAAQLPELSMGMSDDLEAAIAAGATMVRIGTAIFGDRKKP
jgi:PLP dependent protein